ncbi:MAG: metal ABC transporter permease [Nitrospirae bacterium]|nr:metal ABC transporter permease [Nitrospirota bacterium]
MIEILSSAFMQKAFFVGIMVSLISGLVSVFVVLRKMSFIGAGISHAAFGGVAIGFFTGINPLITATIYSIAVALGIEVVSRKGKVSEDASIGIFFASSRALGIILVSLSREYNVDLFGYLFGNILAITDREVLITLLTTISVIGVILLFLKEIFLTTYNEEIAQVSGISVRAINILFLLVLSISIVIAMKVVGIILISALLVIPGATAQLFAKSLTSMIAISCGAAVFSTITGLFLSYEFDIAPGGSIVLTATLLFFISLILRRKR